MSGDHGGAAGAGPRPSLAALVVALLVAPLPGCGEPAPTSPSRTSPPPPPPTSSAPAAAPRPPDGYRALPTTPGSTGRIEGRCALERAVEPVSIRPGMGVDGPVPSESVHAGADEGLSNCVVFLASIEAGKDWPEPLRAEDRTARIRILPGRYEPRVQWTRAGTQLALESRLPMDVPVHGYRGAVGRDTLFDVSVSPDSTLADVADLFLREPGVIFVTDDFRGGFQAYVHVSPHPYVDVTRADASPERPAGSFRLDDVPAGAYDLVCWHEALEPVVSTAGNGLAHYRPGPEMRVARAVRVLAGATTRADFTLPVPAPAPR